MLSQYLVFKPLGSSHEQWLLHFIWAISCFLLKYFNKHWKQKQSIFFSRNKYLEIKQKDFCSHVLSNKHSVLELKVDTMNNERNFNQTQSIFLFQKRWNPNQSTPAESCARALCCSCSCDVWLICCCFCSLIFAVLCCALSVSSFCNSVLNELYPSRSAVKIFCAASCISCEPPTLSGWTTVHARRYCALTLSASTRSESESGLQPLSQMTTWARRDQKGFKS